MSTNSVDSSVVFIECLLTLVLWNNLWTTSPCYPSSYISWMKSMLRTVCYIWYWPNYVGLDAYVMYEVTHCTGHIRRWDLYLESGIPSSLSSQTISHPPEEWRVWLDRLYVFVSCPLQIIATRNCSDHDVHTCAERMNINRFQCIAYGQLYLAYFVHHQTRCYR